MTHGTIARYAAEERQFTIPTSTPSGPTFQSAPFRTIAAHLYQGAYFPGTRPGAAADQTRFTVGYSDGMLTFDLIMEEPKLDELLEWLPDTTADNFWQSDFVCLNVMTREGKVVQVGVKVTGESQVRKDFRDTEPKNIRVNATQGTHEWEARLELPLAYLGYDESVLRSNAIPFDVVRLHSSSGATTAWCPIPSQLPFNENYDHPVFCFGLLAAERINWEDYAGQAQDIGTFRYNGPSTVTAGTYTSFGIEYTVGRHGFPRGASLKFNFSNEVIECNRRSRQKRHLPEKDWSPLQWDDPALPGYVQIICSREKTVFELSNEGAFSTKAVLKRGPALEPGDRIRIAVAEAEDCPGIRAQLLSQNNYPLKVYTDVVGNGIYLSPPDFPQIDVVGGPATKLLVHSPPTPDPGETVRLTVTAVDSLGNIADGYRGRITVHCPVANNGLPTDYQFTEEDKGTHTFEAKYQGKGVFQIVAKDTRDPVINGVSDLIVTDGSFGPGKIYFGDIHTHSQLSDGRLHPEDKFREIAHHRGLDFWALTDHGHDFNVERLEQLHRTIDTHNQDNRFATIFGFEWTNSMGLLPRMRKNYGHRNIYFRSPPKVIRDGVDAASASPQRVHRLYEQDGVDFFCINHFHCGSPETYADVDRAVEVSGWCGEFNRDNLNEIDAPQGNIFDAFDAGHHVGVVAGTDHGTEAYYAGLPAELTAVHTNALTRDTVYDALKEGCTYGTSGQRTLLRFTLNDQLPCADAMPVAARQRDLRLVVGSAYPVQRIQVIRNRDIWQVLDGFRCGVQAYALTDRDPVPKEGYYLVRVFTAQGHTTWSSPLFYTTVKSDRATDESCQSAPIALK
ncbi:MAG: CehA/McbA family metallohydrolase [Candidatus Pacebacteria bacterium]|nr:CehA/McbA family metallohydrolase [Candidatus Paceibacterota bacterium]